MQKLNSPTKLTEITTVRTQLGQGKNYMRSSHICFMVQVH